MPEREINYPEIVAKREINCNNKLTKREINYTIHLRRKGRDACVQKCNKKTRKMER